MPISPHPTIPIFKGMNEFHLIMEDTAFYDAQICIVFNVVKKIMHQARHHSMARRNMGDLVAFQDTDL